MKKIALFIAAVFILSFTVNNSEKEFKFTLTQSQVGMLYNSLTESKKAIVTSDIPMKQGVELANTIDSIQRVIAYQYNLQVPPDTTKKK